ncbi:hypothetical protein KSS87_006509 [Heliosperma pusillum]|nr:hypothetical protein KSS87_006509 [Heliosperma pusillum]
MLRALSPILTILRYALGHGARASAVDVEEYVDHETISTDGRTLFKVLQHPVQRRGFDKNMSEDSAGSACHLFAFPSECNFSGVRFNLDLVKAVKKHSEETFKDSSLSKYSNIFLCCML